MKIYVGHSTDLQYEEKLYRPLRNSTISDRHELKLPHESKGFFDSRKYLRDECGLFVAEVSKASTGLGIELGWADSFDVPILCIYEKGSQPSSALKAVTEEVKEYENSEELAGIIKEAVQK